MLARFLGYFSYLRGLLGPGGSLVFAFWYSLAALKGDNEDSLQYIKVGPYHFYFPSRTLFNGLWIQVFFGEAYYLAKTSEPIVVIDAGANIGMSLLYIKLRAPRARVTCFEPNPASRKVLEQNIAANAWGESVEVLPYALGGAVGEADLFIQKGVATSGSASTGAQLGAHGRELYSERVPVVQLSSYIKQPVDFLKIDIEGGEFAVLEDLVARGALASVAEIQLEYHFEPGFLERPLSEMLALLQTAGYKTAVAATAPPHALIHWAYKYEYMVYAWR